MRRHMSQPLLTEETLRQRLAVKVRALRTKLRLTLKTAAGRAAIHWRHWQKIEAAEVNVTMLTLIRLSFALNSEPAELLSAS